MLNGIRIIEFEALGPGPFSAMHLADLGAEVILVQRKGGEANPAKGASRLLDRGKRSIALDLKDDGDLGIARALIRSADGLIEGMRPGVMERLGLGPEAAQALNPRLVYGRMTGWGQDGPRATLAGHDLNYLGLSGALFYAGLPGQVPGVPPTMLGDIGAGALYLTVGMLAGLLQARETGQGTVVDAAIVDGAQHMMALLRSMGPGFDTGARGRSLLDGPHWSRCYACSCGGHVALQCLEPKFYALFLDRMGLAEDPDFADQFDPDRWPVQGARLERIFAAQPRDHWAALFEDSDACLAPVLSPDEAACDPHMTARGHGPGSALPAPRFDGGARATRPAPDPGQDGVAILEELRERGLL
ncbi:CaiB/BaiF CoA transferase family protein [Mameliella alba]|uniref:CaiB/BaiF CoA transferase family protein n=1 Tax=Mameliella alba TaxID=561184 RepID=UPI000B52C563|nr:CaiB/BaiF CoA-transferase family protein [Mameliella alba]MBY6118070.1 CoA transferase [Mameliella alba]OWV42228.1 CoA transferase [Mameliella alba]OWV63959.1 CoA transferase [Mameliella alba]